MADLSQLGTLNKPEPTDLNDYPEAGMIAPPPPKGQYNGQAPKDFAFGKTNAGDLSVTVDPITIVGGGVGDGYRVRFTRLSFKRFKRGTKLASQMEDYLRAHGIANQSDEPEAVAQLVEATADRTFPFRVDWEAYCKKCQEVVAEGYETFPADGNGGRQPWKDCPTCGTRVRANARIPIGGFVSTVQK